MMSHTICVPDAIWEWAQQFYNAPNPSTELRGILYEGMMEKRVTRAPLKKPPISESTKTAEKSPPFNGHEPFDSNTYSDPLPAKRPGYCCATGNQIKIGDLICMKNKRQYSFAWVRDNEWLKKDA